MAKIEIHNARLLQTLRPQFDIVNLVAKRLTQVHHDAVHNNDNAHWLVHHKFVHGSAAIRLGLQIGHDKESTLTALKDKIAEVQGYEKQSTHAQAYSPCPSDVLREMYDVIEQHMD